jgi:hypothetical protein
MNAFLSGLLTVYLIGLFTVFIWFAVFEYTPSFERKAYLIFLWPIALAIRIYRGLTEDLHRIK